MHYNFISSRLYIISNLKPFAKGGKRAIYVHPDNPDWCIKVNLPDQQPIDLWKNLPFLRRIRKSVDDMNENWSDYKTLNSLARSYDECIWRHVPRCHGWAQTDIGPGLVVDLIRDADGLISRSLLAHLWDDGLDSVVNAAVDELIKFWVSKRIPSRSLGLHNIAARRLIDGRVRLVVIDGFGATQMLKFPILAAQHARKRAENIRVDIKNLSDRKEKKLDPGKYGFLLSRT